jgi:ribonuclease-3
LLHIHSAPPLSHIQEFEVECSIPKLDIQVYGTGGSRRAGEQAAALLALAAVQAVLENSPTLPRKSRQRTTQLKLAGIATFQPDAPENKSEDTRKSGKQPRGSVQQEQETLLPDSDDPTKRITQSKSA